jgi:hypothetical protein
VDEATEALQREVERVNVFPGFDSSQRIWWIYLGAAVEKWLERIEDPEIRAAFDRLKTFPENLIDEAARWMDLREAERRAPASCD